MQNFNILFLLLICISCSNNKPKEIYKPATKEALIGKWSAKPKGEVALIIDAQQIHFQEDESGGTNSQSYSYRLGGDSIVMDLPDYSFSYKIQLMEGDSLRLFTDKQENVYHRIH